MYALKVGSGFKILRPLRRVLRITVVKHKFKVKCSMMQVIMKRFHFRKITYQKIILSEMNR